MEFGNSSVLRSHDCCVSISVPSFQINERITSLGSRSEMELAIFLYFERIVLYYECTIKEAIIGTELPFKKGL